MRQPQPNTRLVKTTHSLPDEPVFSYHIMVQSYYGLLLSSLPGLIGLMERLMVVLTIQTNQQVLAL